MLPLIYDVGIYEPHVQWDFIIVVQTCEQRLLVLQNAGTYFLSRNVCLHRKRQEIQDVTKISGISNPRPKYV